MNRRHAAVLPTLLTVVLAPLAVLSTASPADAAPTCNGREATLVGPGTGGVLTGTEGVDVVVTNGATEVDTLGGNDLVCVTNVSGDTAIDTGSGNDAVKMTDGTGSAGASSRRAAGEVVVVLGEGNDAFYSYAHVRGEGVGPGGTVDLGPGSDRASVQVDDSNDVATPADTTGVLDLDGGTGPDEIRFSTVEMVELVGPEDGDIDIDRAAGTAELAGRTQVTYARFESERVLAAGRLTLDGTDGPDRVVAVACTSLIRTGPGSDRIDLVQGLPEYADEYRCTGGPTRIHSGAHSDVVRIAAFGYSKKYRDDIPVILGGSGADTLIGGRAVVHQGGAFGSGPIRAYGEEGNDLILGGDVLSDAPGIINGDVLSGGPGNDVVRGFKGPDVLYGYGGADRLDGGAGRDTGYGGTGRDVCATEVRKGCERR